MVRWEHLATRWVERRRAPLSIVTDLKLRSSGLMPAAPSFASSWSFTGCFCAILLQFRWRRRGTAEGAAPGHNQRQARAWHGGSASGPPRRERWLGRARARVCVRPLGSPPACGFVCAHLRDEALSAHGAAVAGPVEGQSLCLIHLARLLATITHEPFVHTYNSCILFARGATKSIAVGAITIIVKELGWG